MTDFKLANRPAPKAAEVKENEYTPLVKQLLELGLDSGQEFRGVFDNQDAVDIAKNKFRTACRREGLSSLIKVREPLEDEKVKEGQIVLGLSIREKIERPRKSEDDK